METVIPASIRIEALKSLLEEDERELIEPSTYDKTTFEVDGKTFKVLTESEADEAVKEYIKNSVWSFNPEWILPHTNLPQEALEMIQAFQEKKCEDANETFLALLKDFDHFVKDSVLADGRGHFLAGYDSEEQEASAGNYEFLVYRDN